MTFWGNTIQPITNKQLLCNYLNGQKKIAKGRQECESADKVNLKAINVIVLAVKHLLQTPFWSFGLDCS